MVISNIPVDIITLHLKMSVERFTVIILIFLGTIVIQKIVKIALERYFKKSSIFIKVDPTNYNFLKHTVSGLIYIIGIGLAIYMIPALRALSVSMLAGAGVLAIVIGFASQQAFSNIISGIFLVIFKPYRVGDRVKIGTDVAGIVEDISLRHTVIKTYENKRMMIPNSIISNEKIENGDIGDQKTIRFVEIGISYDSDVDLAMKIMREEAMKHPNFIDNRTEEEKKNKDQAVPVRVVGFGDSSVNLKASVWAEHPGKAYTMGCDLNKSIKERFDKEGIEIPFPYRTIVYKNDIERKPKKRR